MSKIEYAIEENGPIRVKFNMDLLCTFTISFDGKVVAKGEASTLTKSPVYELFNGSILKVQPRPNPGSISPEAYDIYLDGKLLHASQQPPVNAQQKQAKSQEAKGPSILGLILAILIALVISILAGNMYFNIVAKNINTLSGLGNTGGTLTWIVIIVFFAVFGIMYFLMTKLLPKKPKK